MLFGTAALIAGVALTLLAIARASVGILFVGTAIAGSASAARSRARSAA